MRHAFKVLTALLMMAPVPALAELPILRVSVQLKDYIETWELSGVSKDAPYRLEWSVLGTATDETASLLARTTDVALGEGTVSVTLQHGGSSQSWADGKAPVAIVGAFVPRDPVNYKSMITIVRVDSPIKTAADLKGKSLTFKKGGNMYTQSVLAVKKGGLKFSEVTPVDLSPPDGLVAFRSGQVDVLTNSPGQVKSLIDDGKARILLSNTDVGFPAGIATVVRTADLKDPARTALLRDFVQRIRLWNDWKANHPNEVQKVLEASLHLRPEVAAFQARADVNDQVVVDETFLASEQLIADALAEAGGIPKTIDVHRQYDLRFNDDAAKPLAAH